MKTHPFLLPAAVLPLLLCLLPACRTSTDTMPPRPPELFADAEPVDADPLPPSPVSADADADTFPALHILRWNPAISSFTEDTFLEGLDRIDRDGSALTSWSLYDWDAVLPGDWAIFARVGGEGPDSDGIAGICRMVSPPYEALSWRGDGSTVHYAEIDLCLLNTPAATGLLAAPELESLFPRIDWHGGHSGVPVPSGIAARLALVIADRLASADPAAFPAGSFAAADLEILPYRLVSHLCPGLRAAPRTVPLRLALDWAIPFDPKDTHPSTFHTPAGDVTVPFMNCDTTARSKTLSLPGWTALVLPLAGDAFELLFIIPPRTAIPDEIEAALPEALASERTAPGRIRSVFLSLPQLAVQAAGPVLHSIRLELDEGSSEEVLPATTPLPPPAPSSKPVRVLLNRPFVLALRDTQTSSLLLLSRVLSP